MRLGISLLMVIGLLVTRSEAEVRVFRDTTGQFSIEAEVASIIGDNVILKKTDGGTLQVPLAKLSEADRKYVDAWKAQRLKSPVQPAAQQPVAAGTVPQPATSKPAPSAGPAAAALDAETVLNKPISFDFVGVPLRDAVQQLAEQSRVAIVIDRSSLIAGGIDAQTPLTGKSGGKSFYEELNAVLKPHKLCCLYEQEAIVVTSLDDAASYARTYPYVYRVVDPQVFTPGFKPGVAMQITVGPMATPPVSEPFEPLMTDLVTNFHSDSWGDNGGTGHVRYLIPFRPLPAPIQISPPIPTLVYAAAGMPVLVVTQSYEITREFELRYAGKFQRIARKPTKPQAGRTQAVPPVMSALNKPTKCDYRDVPLKDLLAGLAANGKVAIDLDVTELEELGIDPLTSITTMQLDGLKLSNVLHHILDPLDLSYYPDAKGIHVQNKAKTEEKQVTVSYNVANLTASTSRPQQFEFDSLHELVTTMVRPASWEEVGGKGKIVDNPQTAELVVTQDFAAHRQIADLLADLHESWNPPQPGKR